MAPKRATYMTYGKDARCAETRKYIEEKGVLLNIRNLETEPLSEDELSTMLGHIPLKYFLNPSSPSYAKNGLDKDLPERADVLKMMAEDHTLIKRPIIKTTRLIMAGCDRKKVTEILDLGRDPDQAEDKPSHGRKRQHRVAATAGK